MTDQLIDPSTYKVTLAPILDLRAAVPLADALKAHRGHDVEIDASEVARVGAQCVQVLLSALKTWREEARRLEIVASSDVFEEGVKLLGVELPISQNVGESACL